MSKIIIVKGCKTCPFCVCTDDLDSYSGYKCELNNNIGWLERVFHGLNDEYVEPYCPLHDYKEENEDEKIRKELLQEIWFIPARNGEHDMEDNLTEAYYKRIERYKAWLEKQKPVEWPRELGELVLSASIHLKESFEDVDPNSQLGLAIRKEVACLQDLYHEAFYPSTYNMREDIKNAVALTDLDGARLDAVISIVEDWENAQSEKEKKYYGEHPYSEWLKNIKRQTVYKSSEK